MIPIIDMHSITLGIYFYSPGSAHDKMKILRRENIKIRKLIPLKLVWEL